MSLQIVITDAGKAEIINAENTGTAPVTISEIGFGSGQYTASTSQTALVSEIKRLNTISGVVVGDDTIHVTGRDESADSYDVFEIGLFLESGTLFAVYSQNTPILNKSAQSIALIAIDIAIQSLNPASVTFGDANFTNPPATTENEGVVKLATNAEVQAGTDTQKAVTPGSISSRTATTTRTGLVELATNAEAADGTDSIRAVTPAGVKAAIDNSAPPDATTTQKGIIELATNAETQSGNDSSRAVTPAGLASLTATESRRGIVELANESETQAGNDSSRAVTPAGLASLTATESRRGIVELANESETQAGNDSSKAVTPAGLNSRLATRTTAGLVELATNPETQSGIDAARAVTPAGLKSWSDDRGVYGEDNNEMIGSVAYFITTVAPDGWIKANGAAVSRTTYAKLFAKVGTFWGNGNGSTTFNVPDLRGEFIRCWDDGRGVDSGRSFGTFQADEFKEHRHSLPSRDNAGNGNSYIEDADPGGIVRSAYTGLEGGSETRPRNVALVAYIKY